MEPPDLLPDPEIVLAAAWFDERGALKAANGQRDYGWSTLEKLAITLARHLDMGRDSFDWLVFDKLQLFVQSRRGEALVWLTPHEADCHWIANALALTLTNLQQTEALRRSSELLAEPASEVSAAEAVPDGFMSEFERILAKAVGPTMARRLIIQIAGVQRLNPEAIPIAALDPFVHELSLQIPYRGRRSIFLTEVTQLMRSHAIPPKRIGFAGAQRLGSPGRVATP